MTTRKTLAIALPAALLCGALLGYHIRPARPAPLQEAEKPAPRAHAAAPDEAAIDRLRGRIRALERQLAAATASNAVAQAEEPAPEPERPRNPFLRNGPPHMPTAAEMRAHMEELRTVDPERYAQMTNRFARWREHRLKRTSDRLDILASVDTSRLSEKERQTHDALQEAIARREELQALLNPQNEDITEEQRRKTFEELRELGHKMRQLEKEERNTLLTKTARSFGLSKADAQEMAETVKAIYNATGAGDHRNGPPFGGHERR